MDYNERFCYECEHCELEPMQPGYSEYTPGCDFIFRCRKKNLDFTDFFDRKDFRDRIRSARTCKFFKQVENLTSQED